MSLLDSGLVWLCMPVTTEAIVWTELHTYIAVTRQYMSESIIVIMPSWQPLRDQVTATCSLLPGKVRLEHWMGVQCHRQWLDVNTPLQKILDTLSSSHSQTIGIQIQVSCSLRQFCLSRDQIKKYPYTQNSVNIRAVNHSKQNEQAWELDRNTSFEGSLTRWLLFKW